MAPKEELNGTPTAARVLKLLVSRVGVGPWHVFGVTVTLYCCEATTVAPCNTVIVNPKVPVVVSCPDSRPVDALSNTPGIGVPVRENICPLRAEFVESGCE